MGEPRGYAPFGNIALERAIGTPGVPLGRITEISGWEAAGKSTVLDQILATTQAMGGLCVLADTERARNRAYMHSLGVQPESLIWIGGRTVEAMFDEVETLARTASHYNALAWFEALKREGVKVSAASTYKYVVFDPTDQTRKRPVASYDFMTWGRAQAASLLDYQKANGLPGTGRRDEDSRRELRPVILHGENKDDNKTALADWLADEPNDLAQPADRPIVIGWDSVAGTATEAELEGSARDQHVATAAKVIRRNLRRLIQLIDDEAMAMILVNQRYEKINMGGGRSWGRQSETYGGGGIKYHSTIRVELEKIGIIHEPGARKSEGHPPCGQEVLIKVPKNKLNSPYRTERFGLIFGKGADDAWAIHEDLKERGIIRVGGGWSKFADPTVLGEEKSFRGWTELRDMLADDSELSSTLRGLYLEGAR
jgi:RecA/RadA recombinase